jgi:hypothetical protein
VCGARATQGLAPSSVGDPSWALHLEKTIYFSYPVWATGLLVVSLLVPMTDPSITTQLALDSRLLASLRRCNSMSCDVARETPARGLYAKLLGIPRQARTELGSFFLPELTNKKDQAPPSGWKRINGP